MILGGPTKKVLAKLAMPLVFSNIIATLYNLADGIWLARLSYTEFAATSFTWPLVFLFISIAIGISIAGTSIISQMIGANDREKATQYANNLIILCLVLGTFFSILGFSIAPILIKVMGAKGDLLKYSTTYFKVNTLGILVDTMYFGFQAILNAQGKTKSTTIMGLVSGLLNIILDPVFIFATIPWTNIPGFNLGVAGAAIATILAKIIAVIIGYVKIKQDTSNLVIGGKHFKINRQIIKNLFSMAVPTAIGRSSAALGFSVMNALIVSYGQEIVAAFSMVNRVTDFWMQISMGIGAAMTAMIGQNIGAKQYLRAKQIKSDAILFAMVTSFIGVVIIIFFHNPLLSIFIDKTEDPSVYGHAMDYIYYAMANVPFMALFNIYQSLFQGIGHMKYSMHMSTGRLWFIRVPLVLLLTKFTSIGTEAIWAPMLISNVLIVVYAMYIVRSRKLMEVVNA